MNPYKRKDVSLWRLIKFISIANDINMLHEEERKSTTSHCTDELAVMINLLTSKSISK